jgi:peptide/nickel transport system permease protein
MTKRTKKFLILSIPALLCVLIALFPHLLTASDPIVQDLNHMDQSPSWAHLLGTDRYGRDMLARVLYGAKYSIGASLAVTFASVLAGTVIGTAAGWKGGKVQTILMRLADIFLSFPGLVLALAMAAVLGGGLENGMLSILCISWPKYARFAMSEVLRFKNLTFLKALHLYGVPSFRIAVFHGIPYMLKPLIVLFFLDTGTKMMALAGLSFLGLGAQPPLPEWGAMMYEGRSFLTLYPWLLLAPGMAMTGAVISFNLFGEALREWLDRKETV